MRRLTLRTRPWNIIIIHRTATSSHLRQRMNCLNCGISSMSRLPRIAGKTVPWSIANINHTEAQFLQRQLVEAGYAPEQLPGLLYDIWLEKVHPNKDGGGLGEVTGQIMQKAHFKSLQEANRLLGAITAYSNSIPTWMFKGRSSDEMFGKDSKRGEKLATASAMISQMSHGFQQASAFPKVGRNDPCPCGSGLKYKNCHGKNLS